MKSTLERFLLALACNVNPACCYFMPAVYPAWGPRVKALHEFIYFWWEITTVLEGDNIFIPTIFRGMSLIAQNLIWFRWNKHLAIYQKRTKILAAAWWDFLLLNHLKKKKKNPVIGPILPQLHNSNQKQKRKENKTEKNAPPWSSETHSPFNKTWPCTSTAPYRWNQWMMVWDNVTSRCTCQPFLSVARRQLCSA